MQVNINEPIGLTFRQVLRAFPRCGLTGIMLERHVTSAVAQIAEQAFNHQLIWCSLRFPPT